MEPALRSMRASKTRDLCSLKIYRSTGFQIRSGILSMAFLQKKEGFDSHVILSLVDPQLQAQDQEGGGFEHE